MVTEEEKEWQLKWLLKHGCGRQGIPQPVGSREELLSLTREIAEEVEGTLWGSPKPRLHVLFGGGKVRQLREGPSLIPESGLWGNQEALQWLRARCGWDSPRDAEGSDHCWAFMAGKPFQCHMEIGDSACQLANWGGGSHFQKKGTISAWHSAS